MANPYDPTGPSNPFGGEANPFSGEEVAPASEVYNPADAPAQDEVAPVQQDAAPMTEAETTRPRQLPASLIPIFCHACSRQFQMARISANLKCICGSDDLDLDDRPQKQAMEGDPPWGHVLEGDQPLGLLEENDEFATPFPEEDLDEALHEDDEAVVAKMARYIIGHNRRMPARQAVRLARKAILRYPHVLGK